MDRLRGKTAIITGAVRGLGAAMARLFHAEGASVIVTGADAHAAEELLLAMPGSRFRLLNVTDESHWQRLADELAAETGRLEILVNNAAITHFSGILETSPALFRQVLEVNLTGVFVGLRILAPLLCAAGGASVINISSCAGLQGVNGASAYVASKWGLTGLTKAAALELGHAGVRVNSVHPHAIRTDMIAGRDAGGALFEDQAIDRIADPEEVARMALFLASDDSGYCTGAEFLVDGGHMAGRLLRNMPAYRCDGGRT